MPTTGPWGLDNDFIRRNTPCMTWKLMHPVRRLTDRGARRPKGDQRTARDQGERFDHPNLEYR